MGTNYDTDDAPDKDRLYPELAKANLLRIRGDYKGAIDQCLSILKRFPEDHDAHVLIADIYAEQGDLSQAAQWYELAIDISPNAGTDRAKLVQLQQRIKDREAASAAQQLGLPPEKQPLGLYIGVMGAIALVVAIGSYMLGQQAMKPPAGKKLVPISAPLQAENASTGGTAAPMTITSASTIEEDRLVQQALATILPNGTILMNAMQDPRNKGLVLTVSIRPEDNERGIAAELGRAALVQYPSAPGVIMRLVKYGRLAHVATVSRDRLASLETPEFQNGTATSEAVANAILTEEWSAAAAVNSPAPVAPANTPSDTTTPPAGQS